MKYLILTVVLILVSIDVSAQASSAAAQEADKLNAEVVKLFKQKSYFEALPLAEKVVAIREKEFGRTHLSVAQAWRNLGSVQDRLERSEQAKKSFENALEIYEANQSLSSADERAFIEMLDIVGTLQANEGEIARAEKKLSRAIELVEKSDGKDSIRLSNSLIKLAQIYQINLDYKKALPLSLRALEIRNAKLGKANDETEFAYENSSCVLNKLGEKQQAEQLSEKYYPKPRLADSLTAGGIKTINGGIVNGKALALPKPAYPAEAKAKRVTGTIPVRVVIDEAGKVIFACAINGNPLLHRASEVSAYNSKFAPTTLGGTPVRVIGIINYNFSR